MRFTAKKVNPETHIKRACLQCLQYQFGPRLWFVNIIGGLGIRPGTPDTLLCLDGKFIAIEFKRPGGRLRPTQESTLLAIVRAGGIALVIDSVDECIEAFKQFKGCQGELC